MSDPVLDEWRTAARAAVREWVQGGKEAKTLEAPSHSIVEGIRVTHTVISYRGFTMHVTQSPSGGRTVCVVTPDRCLQTMHHDDD
jgi:hypothetical protein